MKITKTILNFQLFQSQHKILIQTRMDSIKACNCKASKCAKAYCDCFAAKQYCGIHCHCVDCQNHDPSQAINTYQKSEAPQKHPLIQNQELTKSQKGCACKKSNCMKKYCECFNAGIVCTEACKCIQCQNSESFINRKVIKELKKNDVQTNSQPLCNNRVLLAENSQQIMNIKCDFEKNSNEMKWLGECAERFCNILQKSEPPLDPRQGIPDHPFSKKTKEIIDQFLLMLKEIQASREKASENGMCNLQQ